MQGKAGRTQQDAVKAFSGGSNGQQDPGRALLKGWTQGTCQGAKPTSQPRQHIMWLVGAYLWPEAVSQNVVMKRWKKQHKRKYGEGGSATVEAVVHNGEESLSTDGSQANEKATRAEVTEDLAAEV